MKKRNLFFISIIMALLLVGCGDNNHVENNENTNSAAIGTVTIELTKENGAEELSKDEVDLYEGDTLMDVMERNYEIETAYEGAFIHGIDGIAPAEGESYAWLYTVNNEEVMVGANEYELEVGDLVQFDFAAWE